MNTPLVFPSNRTIVQLFSQNGKSYQWNGESWISLGTEREPGFTGSIGFTGSTGGVSGVLTSNLNAGEFIISNAKFQTYKETIVTISPISGILTLDLSQSNVFTVVLTENSTINFINPPTTGVAFSITLVVKQDGVGNRTLSYPVSVFFTDGTIPVLSTIPNKLDVLTFLTFDGGSMYLGGQAYANL